MAKQPNPYTIKLTESERAEIEAYARAQAAKLATKPLTSLVATKALMKQPAANGVREAMLREGEVFGRMLREPAAREAFSAFLEKRRPDFSKIG